MLTATGRAVLLTFAAIALMGIGGPPLIAAIGTMWIAFVAFLASPAGVVSCAVVLAAVSGVAVHQLRRRHSRSRPDSPDRPHPNPDHEEIGCPNASD
jgi:hypothetical protein